MTRTNLSPVRSLAANLARGLGRVAAGALVPLGLLGLWHLCARREWVSTLVLPPPSVVWQTAKDLLADGTIKANLAISALRVAKGFALGGSAGLALGTALGLSRSLKAYVQPTIQGLSHVNLLAWVPLLMLLFGIDEPLKVAAISLATFIPVLLTTVRGVEAIPPGYFELARAFGLGRFQVVRRIALPAALPALFTGLRTGLQAAWTSLVVVELIASSEGVGFMVVWGRQLFQLDVVLVAIVLVGSIGLFLDLGLRRIEQHLHRWQQPSRSGEAA